MKDGADTISHEEITDRLNYAYRRGAEAMREAAAKACEATAESNEYAEPSWYAGAGSCADAIRALPVPERIK